MQQHPSTRARRRTTALAVAVTAVLGLAGCGGGAEIALEPVQPVRAAEAQPEAEPEATFEEYWTDERVAALEDLKAQFVRPSPRTAAIANGVSTTSTATSAPTTSPTASPAPATSSPTASPEPRPATTVAPEPVVETAELAGVLILEFVPWSSMSTMPEDGSPCGEGRYELIGEGTPVTVFDTDDETLATAELEAGMWLSLPYEDAEGGETLCLLPFLVDLPIVDAYRVVITDVANDLFTIDELDEMDWFLVWSF